jgi:AAA domain/Toprim domain
MSNTAPTKKTAQQIGDEALVKLGLPASSCFENKIDAKSYYFLGQALLNRKNNKPDSDFLVKNLDIHALKHKAINAPELLNSETINAWTGWLLTIPEIQKSIAESIKTKESNKAKASPLLNYFAELTKLLDTDEFAASKNMQIIDLAKLRAEQPRLEKVSTGAVLAFAIPTKSKNARLGFKVLFTCKLETSNTAAVMGLLQPCKDPDLIISQSEFFTEDGFPKGNFDADSIEEIFGKSWEPQQISSWDAFLEELDGRCIKLFGGALHEFVQRIFGNHVVNLQALLVAEDDVKSGMWAEVFQNLKDGSLISAAVDEALKGVETPEIVSLTNSPRQDFIGQMDTQSEKDPTVRAKAFPLDSSQRLAAIHAAVLGNVVDGQAPQSRILAINGPPGTGKTSFLRAVLASKWVQAAINQDASPPIVIGTGYTNKSVINMIEAFGNVAGTLEASMEARWLVGLPSYGWFLPSSKAAEKFPNLMQLTWNEATKNPYTPNAGASNFLEQSLAEKQRIYIEMAKTALAIEDGQEVSVVQVVDMLHMRMKSIVNQMRHEQVDFDKLLSELPDIWQSASKLNGERLQLIQATKKLTSGISDTALMLANLHDADAIVETYIDEYTKYKTGWRSWLPGGIQKFFWESAFQDLTQIEIKCASQCKRVNIQWEKALPLARRNLKEIQGKIKKNEQIDKADQSKLREFTNRLIEIEKAKRLRKNHVQSIIKAAYHTDIKLANEVSTARYICKMGCESKNNLQASDILLARHESLHDLNSRVKLFHLAARYWEGRWVLAETEAVQKKKNDIQSRLGRLMMLGVIIVATTHKYCGLGKSFKDSFKADLLIMDEAGQCPVEIAVGALAFTKTAIFVGDVKQLQPITTLSVERVERLAVSVGIQPNQLPESLCYKRGSGMAMAQRASRLFDGVDAQGVTLLYHYRCHPSIIGYSNQLLYKGKIKAVRASIATLSNMPPMAWVQVDGNPQQVGSSWVNEEEIDAIAKWISENHQDLSKAYGNKPLDEILAVITPLAAQAHLAEKYLLTHLSDDIDKQVIEKMTIGTVHKLQGAERPVVLFSLVQNTMINPTLFADRDSGYLMNVAVSRAKDSFVVFGSRQTLNPAPNDSERAKKLNKTPINVLGGYLRKHGKRLFPTALVVVEAKGKVDSIQRFLGSKVKVIETNGSLCDSRLVHGELQWTQKSNAFANTLKEHTGLIDSIVLATDDDIAGELIGLHAAEIMANIFPSQTQIKRMRFHSVVEEEIKLAYKLAGDKFDADYLAAALVREYARHLDLMQFNKALPGSSYVSAQARDMVDICMKLENQSTWTVQATLQDVSGNQYNAFIPESTATLSPPKTFASEEAMAITNAIMGGTVNYIDATEIQQIPTLYPPSTTHEVLAAAANELNMLPWDTQNHLNAMYQEGAR